MPQSQSSADLSAIRMSVLKWIDVRGNHSVKLNAMTNLICRTHHVMDGRITHDYKGPAFRDSVQLTAEQISEAVSMLIAQGLAYISYNNHVDYPTEWLIRLTELGQQVARDSGYNPYDDNEYIGRIKDRIPQVSETILQYVREALGSFQSRCFLASAVMLGVASESAFEEMAQSFGNWLTRNGQGNAGQSFLQMINNKRTNYTTKFEEFRKRIDAYKPQLPRDLSDGMALTFDAVLDLLRIYRNESGHPTGKQIDHDTAFINLQMFARYLEKLFQFKAFFDRALDGGFLAEVVAEKGS